MIKFLKGLFGGKSSPEFSVEIRTNKSEKTKWDKISEMDIPSSEKIKLVSIQEMPISDGDIIEAERKSKRYTITIVPQAKDCFDYDEEKKITAYVLAGSKGSSEESVGKLLINLGKFASH